MMSPLHGLDKTPPSQVLHNVQGGPQIVYLSCHHPSLFRAAEPLGSVVHGSLFSFLGHYSTMISTFGGALNSSLPRP